MLAMHPAVILLALWGGTVCARRVHTASEHLQGSMAISSGKTDATWEVDTLIFDIDDTLYSASCGFSEHRMENVTRRFMAERLGFRSPDEAFSLWTEYIRRYHSTLKGLKVATQEGRLPRPFREEDLGAYWAEHCDFAQFLSRDEELINALEALQDSGLKLVVFTNAPRLYGLQVLDALGLRKFFPDERVFGVEDVMPVCKPEPQAFQKVLSSVGSQANRTVMFEDSMKNIRACRAIGMHTVLIQESANLDGGEAKLYDDAADAEDPAVGAVLPRANAVLATLPGLLEGHFHSAYRSAPS